MEVEMRSEQVYWVFTVTEKEPGALQFECNVGDRHRATTSCFSGVSQHKV
jgi:hypothetical protein